MEDFAAKIQGRDMQTQQPPPPTHRAVATSTQSQYGRLDAVYTISTSFKSPYASSIQSSRPSSFLHLYFKEPAPVFIDECCSRECCQGSGSPDKFAEDRMLSENARKRRHSDVISTWGEIQTARGPKQVCTNNNNLLRFGECLSD